MIVEEMKIKSQSVEEGDGGVSLAASKHASGMFNGKKQIWFCLK